MARYSTVVRDRGRVTIPDAVRRQLDVHTGETLDIEVTDDGAIVLRRRVDIDPRQAWFWTRPWQERMRESFEDVAAGRTTRYESDEAFLAALDERAGD